MVKQNALDDFLSVRPARRGDVCVLLTTRDGKMDPGLHTYLDELRQFIGGRIPEDVHLTVQRFEAFSETMEKQLLQNLLSVVGQIVQFDAQASGYFPIHSDFRNLHILKMIISGSEPLEKCYRLVDQAGREAGMKPMYVRRATGALVTALVEIDPKTSPILQRIPLPERLFQVGRLAITRIIGSGEYEMIGEFTL